MNLEKYLISPDSAIISALEKIDSNNNGFLIVVDNNNKVIGTLTDGDIRRAFIQGKTIEDYIQGIYNETFTFVKQSTSFNEIIEQFKSPKISFLPILNANDQIENIITKKQLHVLLLGDKKFDLKYDFFSLDEATIEHEIYNRPWGVYKTTFLNTYSRAKIINVYPKEELSLQEHKKREEHWVIIKGEGKLVIGESVKDVYAGDYIYIPKGCKHKLTNKSASDTLMISEIQLGEYFGEDDIIRYEDSYGRV